MGQVSAAPGTEVSFAFLQPFDQSPYFYDPYPFSSSSQHELLVVENTEVWKLQHGELLGKCFHTPCGLASLWTWPHPVLPVDTIKSGAAFPTIIPLFKNLQLLSHSFHSYCQSHHHHFLPRISCPALSFLIHLFLLCCFWFQQERDLWIAFVSQGSEEKSYMGQRLSIILHISL